MGTRALSFACSKGDSYNYFVLQYRYLYELHQYINTSPSIKQVRDEQHYLGVARRGGDDQSSFIRSSISRRFSLETWRGSGSARRTKLGLVHRVVDFYGKLIARPRLGLVVERGDEPTGDEGDLPPVDLIGLRPPVDFRAPGPGEDLMLPLPPKMLSFWSRLSSSRENASVSQRRCAFTRLSARTSAVNAASFSTSSSRLSRLPNLFFILAWSA